MGLVLIFTLFLVERQFFKERQKRPSDWENKKGAKKKEKKKKESI